MRAANDAIAAAEREAGSAVGEATGSIVGRAVWGAMMSVASATAILLATTRPAGRGIVQGSVPGRSDITYDWNQEGLVAYHVLIDGQWRTLGAFQDASGNVRDANGNVLATVSHGPGSALSLTSDAAAIDRAAAALPVDASQASSGLDQIYVDPSTGRTLVVSAGTDPATLPPGFVPMGSDGNADGSTSENQGPTTRQTRDASKPPLRLQYEDAVKDLANLAVQMAAEGSSSEEIARALYAARRKLGVTFKDLIPPDILDKIYARNLERYDDELGPSIDWLGSKGKTWKQIIESASRPGGKDLGF